MSIPKEDERAPGPWSVHYGEAVKIKDANGYTIASLSQIHLHGRRSKSEVAKTAAFIVEACNSFTSLRQALAKVMIGGNHLGLIIGVDHPPYTASHEEARAHYADAIWTYEAWCCWKTIMESRATLSGVTQPASKVEPPMETAMTEAQIKHMVGRFLSWKLPTAFNPDGGISFERIAGASGPHPFPNTPVGTNLFSADQATEMVRHMLEGLPVTEVEKISTDTEVR